MKTYRLLGANGRLGNCLWQVASTVGIATLEGTDARFPPWEYASRFSLPPDLFGEVPETAEDTYDHPHEVVKPYRGYLQELEFLAPVEDKVRAWFQPSPASIAHLRAKYPWFFETDHRTGVHVRRGDVLWPHAVDLFRLVEMDYYEPAMALARERHPDTTFVVFSDAIDWCRSRFPFGCLFASPTGIPEAGGNPTDWEEFFLLLLCDDGHITSNSTFSWWASWLSNDPAPIAPAVWFKGNLAGAEKLFLPDHWTLL